MAEVGIRELKQRANEILRRVREFKETFSVTYRGKLVARIIPVEDSAQDEPRALSTWTAMDRLAEEIGVHWPTGTSAAESVKEQRREL